MDAIKRNRLTPATVKYAASVSQAHPYITADTLHFGQSVLQLDRINRYRAARRLRRRRRRPRRQAR